MDNAFSDLFGPRRVQRLQDLVAASEPSLYTVTPRFTDVWPKSITTARLRRAEASRATPMSGNTDGQWANCIDSDENQDQRVGYERESLTHQSETLRSFGLIEAHLFQRYRRLSCC